MSTELTTIRDLKLNSYYRIVNKHSTTAGIKDEETGEYLWDEYQTFSAGFLDFDFISERIIKLYVKNSISVVIKVLDEPLAHPFPQEESKMYCNVRFVYPDKSNFLRKDGENRINLRTLLRSIDSLAQGALTNFLDHGIISGEEGRTYEPIDLEGASSDDLSIIGTDLF